MLEHGKIAPIGLGAASNVVTTVASLKTEILRQLHLALCKRSKKYAKEVAALKRNIKLLIAAISGYLAASTGFSSAVIAALVASILLLIMKIGLETFCEQISK
jgi:hypothetical protein